AIQQLGRVADEEWKRGAAKFGKIDTCQESDRNSDDCGNRNDLEASEDRVRHAAAGFAGAERELREKSQIQRLPAIPDQVTQDQEQHRHGDDGAGTGQPQHRSIEKLAPPEMGGHFFVPGPVVATINSLASPLMTIVIRKSTSPSSINEER